MDSLTTSHILNRFIHAMRHLLISLLLAVVANETAASEHAKLIQRLRSQNSLQSPGFESSKGWTFRGKNVELDKSIVRNGRQSLRLFNQTMADTSYARQTITFDPPIRHAIRISGWSKAENVKVARDYNIFVDLKYADGTPLWGHIAAFAPGTHDWQYSEHTIDVTKPVKTVDFFVFLREGKGTVWFDDLQVTLAPFGFHSLRVLPDVFGRGTLGVFANSTLPASWKAVLRGNGRPVAQAAGRKMPVQLDWFGDKTRKGEYTLEVTATDHAAGQSIIEKQTVSLSAAEQVRPYMAWTESSMRRVMPHSIPPQSKQSEQDRRRADITLAGHEYESFQIALRTTGTHKLDKVVIDVSDLTCAENGGRIGAKHVQWRQVGYVRIDQLRPHPKDPQAVAGWWPEMLLPVERFNVPPGFTQALWVTVYAPSGTKPGQYVGRVKISPRDLPSSEIEISATVFGFDLPVQGHCKTAFALMDGFLEKVYGKPLSPQLRRKFGDFMLRHRLNPDDISRTDPPELDDLLHYKDRGLNTFNVLNMVEHRGKHPWRCNSPLSKYTPQFKQKIVDRLDPYMADLRKHGLADRAYLYTFDELKAEFFPIIRDYFGTIKQRYPEIHTMTTAKVAQDPELMKSLNIDWNCPLTPVYDFEAAEKCRKAGLQVWAYVCLAPKYPWANCLADHPLIETRILPWQVYQQKIDGLLYWGLNIWSKARNDRPIDPAAGQLLDWSITTGPPFPNLNGDGVLLYPGKDGPIGSIRLANLRDGLEDYEYLWLLAQKTGKIDVARQSCGPVTKDLTHFTRDPTVVTKQRKTIAAEIHAK